MGGQRPPRGAGEWLNHGARLGELTQKFPLRAGPELSLRVLVEGSVETLWSEQ